MLFTHKKWMLSRIHFFGTDRVLKQKKNVKMKKGGPKTDTYSGRYNYYAAPGLQEGFFELRLVSRRKIIFKEKMAR
jgi:hypothetical protein